MNYEHLAYAYIPDAASTRTPIGDTLDTLVRSHLQVPP